MQRVALAALLGLLLSSDAAAWSKFVHTYVCELAWHQLSDEGRALAAKLSGSRYRPDGYRQFSDSCTWADEVRRTTHKATYELHFINVPAGAKAFDNGRDCARFDCVTQAVQRYALELGDESRSNEKRAEALRFLGHFLADLHQPLHVGYANDRGGNDIFVAWKRGRASQRLHAVWDGTIAFENNLADLNNVVADAQSITLQQRREWRPPEIEKWAAESFELARKFAYSDQDGGRGIQTGDTLGDAYEQEAVPIVREQLRKASVRLAWMIDLAARGTLTADMFR